MSKMDPNDDLPNSSYDIREQDRWLPIANVGRVMKNALPPYGKLSREAKEIVQECVSEFISFNTSQAAEKCAIEKRKTLNGEDILFSMHSLGFENYAETLKIYLAKYREFEVAQSDARREKYKKRKALKKKQQELAQEQKKKEENAQELAAASKLQTPQKRKSAEIVITSLIQEQQIKQEQYQEQGMKQMIKQEVQDESTQGLIHTEMPYEFNMSNNMNTGSMNQLDNQPEYSYVSEAQSEIITSPLNISKGSYSDASEHYYSHNQQDIYQQQNQHQQQHQQLHQNLQQQQRHIQNDQIHQQPQVSDQMNQTQKELQNSGYQPGITSALSQITQNLMSSGPMNRNTSSYLPLVNNFNGGQLPMQISAVDVPESGNEEVENFSNFHSLLNYDVMS